MRIGNWMQTATGKKFWPLDPIPEEVHIEDIAAALSKMCRYNGHCLRFYSVAEHCVHVSRLVPKELRLEGLLHDASEAYLSDIIRPIKLHLKNYLQIESNLEQCIASKFGLKWPWPEVVKGIDTGMLAAEMEQIMAPPPEPWDLWLTEPKPNVVLECWGPTKAHDEFMNAFNECTNDK